MASMINRLSRARDFVFANARVLERYLFAYHFEDGPAEPVVRALGAYQNGDGGFGNGLEPDKRTPHSQPQDVEIAFETLDAIGAFGGPLVRRACDWLETITTPEGGVPFSLASANDYPHAPWWRVKAANPPAELNPTAAIAGYLLKHGVRHPWLARAGAFCWRAIEESDSAQFHDLMPMINFLTNTPESARAAPLLARVAETIAAPGVVERDPEAEGYVKKPLDWAPSPRAFAHDLFDEALLRRHLGALADAQEEDGGWPISWQTISPGVELEWRGAVTIKALRTLEAYGA
jgi:hypothetical protein